MSLPRPLLILFTFLALVFAYAGSFYGEPIWDDNQFVFWPNQQQALTSHWLFWRHHIWPLFDSVVAILFKWWGIQTLYWHLFNFALHILNGLMLWSLVRIWRKDWALPLTLLFWLHPLNVMTVAWIVQLKTLLCTFFLLLSCLAAQSWHKSQRRFFYIFAVIAFFLSVSSKSAALPFPWIALGLLLVHKERRWFIPILPFLLITLFSTWRIWDNQQVQSAISKSETAIEQIIKTPETLEIPPQAPVIVEIPSGPTPPAPEVLSVPAIEIETPVPEPEPVPEPVSEPGPVTESAPTTLAYVFHTLGIYLFKPWFPWPLGPIHGPYDGGINLQTVIGFTIAFFTLLIGWWKRNSLTVKLLLVQIAVLIPFLGFIMVPYMTYTSVSEQHFYLMLPFSLALQFWIVESIMKKWSAVIFAVVCGVFIFLTANYTQIFKNERVFYQYVLKERPYNPVATINLAAHYYHLGAENQARYIINRFMKEAEKRSDLKNDHFYPWALKAQEFYGQP